jgi:hypothetical protein
MIIKIIGTKINTRNTSYREIYIRYTRGNRRRLPSNTPK